MNLGLISSNQDTVYFADTKTKVSINLPDLSSPKENSDSNIFKRIGENAGYYFYIGINIAEALAVAAALNSFDNAGTLIAYSLFIRILV